MFVSLRVQKPTLPNHNVGVKSSYLLARKQKYTLPLRSFSTFKPTVLNPTGNILLETDSEKIANGNLLYYKNAVTPKTTYDLYKVEGEFSEEGEKILIGKFKDQFEAVMCMENQPKNKKPQRFWIERNSNNNEEDQIQNSDKNIDTQPTNTI